MWGELEVGKMDEVGRLHLMSDLVSVAREVSNTRKMAGFISEILQIR